MKPEDFKAVIGAALDEKLPGAISKALDEKLQPIYDQLETISRDLREIRRDLGYDNLRIIKRVSETDEEKEM